MGKKGPLLNHLTTSDKVKMGGVVWEDGGYIIRGTLSSTLAQKEPICEQMLMLGGHGQCCWKPHHI